MMLHEKRRPRTFADVIAQEKAVAQIKRYAGADGKGLGGRALWIAGQSGTGKTTLAEIAALWFAGDDLGIIRIVGAELTAEAVHRFQDNCRYAPMFGAGRVLLVNDAQSMKPSVVKVLQDALEAPSGLRKSALFIFTANVESDRLDDLEEAPFFFSRMNCVYLARQGLAQPFAEYCRKVAGEEGLDGQPLEKYVRLAKDCGNNLRRMLERVEAGVMLAKE